MADAFHVASLRWRDPSRPSGGPPRLQQQSAHSIGRPPSPVVRRVHEASGPVAPFHRLQPNTDLRLAPAAPPPEAAFSLFSPPPPPSEPPPPSAVLRERDWGATDLFSTLRTEFSSSGLASLGGAADAHFIAPAEHMKRLFTLPYSEGRVAFPVHNIGGSLVVDGDAAGWESAAAERVTDAAAGEAEAALVDALGRMGLLTGAADAAAGDGGGGEDGGSSAALSFAAVAAAASARPTPAAAPPKPKAPLPAPRARLPKPKAAKAAAPAAAKRAAPSAAASEPAAADGTLTVRTLSLYKNLLDHTVTRSSPDLAAVADAHAADEVQWPPTPQTPQTPSEAPSGADGSERGSVTGGDDERDDGAASPDGAAADENVETRWTFWSAQPSATAVPHGGASTAEAAAAAAPDGGGDDVATAWTYWRPHPLGPSGGAAAARPPSAAGGDGDATAAGSDVTAAADADATAAAGGAVAGRQLSPRPKPPAHAALPSEPSLHPFRQVVHWQLRDMGMLLGTNQHVFSTDEHKAMSLQLCDVSRPLHPLSILNFWLDNVMAAIPATAVCGHVNGVVKGYHILKTEELPHWPGANFDADAVLDNAHALLSFLRAHCTRPGGSYWVLKEADADLIRVFDLHAMFAALRAAGGEQTNPFAASVGTMAFRMAQRRSSDDSGSGAAAAAASRDEHERRRELLLQCISLLDADEKPLLASLAHAQLAEVCAAAGVDAPTATLLRAAAASNDGGGSPRAQQLAARSSSGALLPPPPERTPPPLLLRLAHCVDGTLPESVWGEAARLSHLLEALRLEAAAADGAAEQLGKDIPEMPPLDAALHSERLALAFARACLSVAAAVARPDSGALQPTCRARRAATALLLLRAAAHCLLGRCAAAAAALKFPLPKCAPPPSPLPRLPDLCPEGGATRTASAGASNGGDGAVGVAALLALLGELATATGDALCALSLCDGAAAADVSAALEPLREGLAAAGEPAAARELWAGAARPEVAPTANLGDAAAAFWWGTSLVPIERELIARGGGGGGGGVAAASTRERQLGMLRRLGSVLNDLGQLQLRAGALADAEQAFADGVAAFDHAGDLANAALLRLNRATLCRRRAARHADAAEGARRAAVAALGGGGGRLAPPAEGSAEVRALVDAAAQQRAAVDALRSHEMARAQRAAVRAVEPELLARAVAQHAADEAAAGGALHAIVADGGGDEATVRAAAEALARAQASFDEIGELAHVQLMMRRQGSLFLAAALRDEADGAGPAKSKARLTLALRHYARALAEPLLRAASAPMERCAAEARLELAQFYLARAEVLGGGGGGGGGAGAAGGERQRSYEMALEQARAALARCAAGAPGEEAVAADVRGALADAELHALRDLVKLHGAAGAAQRAAQLRDEYRERLVARQREGAEVVPS